MNTFICDAPTSELADALGPHILWWLNKLGWGAQGYHDRVIQLSTETVWCLSELVPYWATGQDPSVGVGNIEFHEDCPWQPD